jgi:hypothetical protein
MKAFAEVCSKYTIRKTHLSLIRMGTDEKSDNLAEVVTEQSD